MSINTLAARLQYLGENNIDRMNRQKVKSLRAALKNDYNARMIKTELHDAIPAIIANNTTGLKSDYDKKYIDVEFSSGLKPGDTFTILQDDTTWMVYLPIMTETAFLRAEILLCRYSIEVDGKKYPIYFQGPTETDLRWRLKNNVNFNELNLSGTIYVKNVPETVEYFHRFSRFKINGHMWEVQVTDPISVAGILELEIQEYYDNDIAELPEIKKDFSSMAEEDIFGEEIVKPDTTVGYLINDTYYDPKAEWSIKDNPRVEIEGIYEDGHMCKVHINPGTAHPFTLCYGELEKKVEVDWEKPIIQGPQEVYPYDVVEYSILDKELPVQYFVDDESLAKIVYQDFHKCQVEIISSKSGEFILAAAMKNKTSTELKVKIKSL